jgi:hypothetical protein
MTLDEARKVAAAASTADGGCYVCVDGIREILAESFPEFRWKLEDARAAGSRIVVEEA